MTTKFLMGGRLLKPGHQPYVIAEIGINHNRDLNLAYQTIDAAAAAGADAVKFQTFRTEEFMAEQNLMYEYVSSGKRVQESMYDMFKRLELPVEWHKMLQAHAYCQGLEFLSSAADPDSADLLAALDVPAIKIASEDVINQPLLAHVARLQIPVILSTGMADSAELDLAVGVLHKGGCPELLLLHCVSLYPAPDDEINLLRMTNIRDKYQLPVGFSDHSIGFEASMGATALGAVLIEKHFTLNHELAGPDHAFSCNPQELKDLINRIRKTAVQRGRSTLAPSEGEKEARGQFRRSIVAVTDIPAGIRIKRDMLGLKRPGDGIPPSEIHSVVGCKSLCDFKPDDKIQWTMLAK